MINNIIPVVVKADSNIPILGINEVLIQGGTNRVFAFSIQDRGRFITISQSAKIKVYIIWNPKRDINGKLINPKGYELNDAVNGYDITTEDITTKSGATYSIIYVPFKPEFVHSAGENLLILSIEDINDGGTMTYTTKLSYQVQLNDAYDVKFGSTLKTYDTSKNVRH